MDSKWVLALIPAYNEAARIAPVIEKSLTHLPVLVVDDGSADNTAGVAEAAGAAVLGQSPNQGKGAALKAGFRFALQEGYEAVITLDADGQHDPAEIPSFLSVFKAEAADLIIGVRNYEEMPSLRRLANWLGEKAYFWALGQAVPDTQSGYRLISRRLMARLEDSREGGFQFEMDMIAICVREGYKLASVPIQTIYAGETSHNDNKEHLRNSLRMIWQARQGRTGKRG